MDRPFCSIQQGADRLAPPRFEMVQLVETGMISADLERCNLYIHEDIGAYEQHLARASLKALRM